MSEPNAVQRWLMRLAGVEYAIDVKETYAGATPSYPEVNFINMVKDGFRKNELMYACTSKKAASASQVEMKVMTRGKKKDQIEVPNHPFKQLLEQPNPQMSEYDFWQSVIILLDVAGRAPFEKERDRAGRVVALWPLRPDWLHPIPSDKSYISGYSYNVPGVGEQVIDQSDVVDFKCYDPLNQYNSWPPYAVASRVGDVDNSATDYLKIFFEKGGTPPGIIKTVQKLNDAAVSDIRRRWAERYGGKENWLQPAVLDKDADYKQIGMTFKDMGFEILDARNEARICAILHVPPMIVGAKVGLDRSTFTNYGEARRSWWEEDLMPMYVSLLDTIENQLFYEWDDNTDLAWDFTEVPALREERMTLWQRANEGLRMGGITVNEYRSELGYPDVGKTGDVFLRPLNLIEVQLGTAQPAPQPTGGIQPAADVPTEGAALQAFWEMKARHAPDDAERRKAEARLGEVMKKYFISQQDRVLEQIG